MKLNKQEFKVLTMLYAANIDGYIQSEEVRVMLEKTDFDTVEKVEKMFAQMNDSEAFDCIMENKAEFASTEEDREAIIQDICAIVMADENLTVTEEHLLRTMRRLLA